MQVACDYSSIQQLHSADAASQFFECVLQLLLQQLLLPLELKHLGMKEIMQLPVTTTCHAISATKNIQW
jgi:hypothetical protein